MFTIYLQLDAVINRLLKIAKSNMNVFRKEQHLKSRLWFSSQSNTRYSC